MPEYEILGLLDTVRWTEHLHMLPVCQQDIYYTPEYYRLYEELGEGTAQCFVFRKDNDLALYPFLIKPINEFRNVFDQEYFDIQGAYGYNGLITSNHENSFIEEFNNAFSQYCKENNIIAEFTRFHPLLKNEEHFKNIMNVIKNREVVVVDLIKDSSTIWNNEFSAANRNRIRKAIKLGYKTQVLTEPEDGDVAAFIDTYYYTMRLRNAESYYFFTKEYFTNMFKYLKDHIFLINVLTEENEVVASSIFFQYQDYFHFHLGGRSNKADSSVSNFLVDRAIDFAKNEGAKYLHLGGGRSTKEDDSLLRFKRHFSKVRPLLYIGKRIHNQTIYNIVSKEWEIRFPEKIETHKSLILKYRY